MDTRAIVGLIVGLIVMAFGAAVIVFISLKNENAATLLAIGYLMLMAGFLTDLLKMSDKKGESIDKK